MARPIDLRLLHYFVTVAEERNITRAAQRLSMAQPPLSQQMRLLEQRLGVELFERQPSGIALTRAGEALLVRAREVLAGADGLVPYVRQAARGRYRLLKIGLTTSASLHATTSELLRRCAARHEELSIELHDGNAQNLTGRLVDGELDLVLLRAPVLRPDSLEYKIIDHEPLLLALPAAHPLAGARRKRIALGGLAQEAFILVREPGQPGIYQQLLQACSAAGFEPHIAAEVPRMLACLNLVAAGIGISVVPASMQSVMTAHVRCLPCVGLEALHAPLTLLVRKQERRPLVHAVVEEAARLTSHRPRAKRG